MIPRLRMFKELTGWDKRKLTVYVLVNFDTTHEQDLEEFTHCGKWGTGHM